MCSITADTLSTVAVSMKPRGHVSIRAEVPTDQMCSLRLSTVGFTSYYLSIIEDIIEEDRTPVFFDNRRLHVAECQTSE